MKPIAVFQHYPGAGPGYFSDFARQHHLPLQIFRGFDGEPLPPSIRGFSGLVSLGGPMSVNDRLDFIEQEARLIDEALKLNIPILGHCLGSQLLARALGAEIVANHPVRCEIGWYPVGAVDGAPEEWAEMLAGGEVFNWHNENFSLPAGATRLATNLHCHNQAFAHGPHLGTQFHIEITAEMVRDWCRQSDDPQRWGHLPSVQSVEQMQQALSARVQRSNLMAEQLYQRWSRSLLKQD